MDLRLVREPTRDRHTFGVLYLDGHFQCFTLEDAIREQANVPVAQWKVLGSTAIPAGRYRISLTHSVRFGRLLPLVLDVPGFDGIRIHPGNTIADTSGCILVGRERTENGLAESWPACQDVLHAFFSVAGPKWIDIENPRVAAPMGA